MSFDDAEFDDAEFSAARPELFAIAYRMLGTVVDSEDVVQDAYLRWSQADRAAVQSPPSYLKTIVTRLCIDRLRSAKTAREEYVGPWLPEPLDVESSPAVEDRVELAESVSIAFLRLLESLTPEQRAVFLLHDVFQYSFDEVAAIVETSPENCRQLASRARKYLAERKPRFDVNRRQQQRLADEFLAACRSGSLDALLGVLAADAELCSDGGGKVSAARRPILGAENVARFLYNILKQAQPAHSIQRAAYNGQPALVVKFHDRIESVFTLDIADGRVRAIYVMRNPDKLQRITA